MHTMEPTNIDTLTFGLNSLMSHDQGITKPSLSSSSSTSSTSSAAASSRSSLNSLDNHRTHLSINSKHSMSNNDAYFATQQPKTVDLVCPLCKNIFKEPKLLNCLHAFCKSCLVAHAMSECGDGNNSINCPKCKQETMAYEGIDHLQDDYIIHNMLDMTAIEENTVQCTSCSETEKAEARCADCAQYLCEPCVNIHQYMRCFDGHRVVRFEDIKAAYKTNLTKTDVISSQDLKTQQRAKTVIDRGVPIHKPLFCKFHKRESLAYFCNSCQMPICAECVVNSHGQHQYERLALVEQYNVDELDMLIVRAREKIAECSGEMTQGLDQCLSELQDKMSQSKKLIEDTHVYYKTVVDKRKEEIMKELEDKHSNKEQIILEMHNSIDQSINQLNDLIKFVQRCLTNGNCPEILLLKKMIVNQLRYLTDNLPAVYNIDVSLKFQSDRSQFDKVVHDTFGRFITEKELKQRMLNQLQSESMNGISGHQKLVQHQQQVQRAQAQLQKKLELQQQELLMANMLKSQQDNLNTQQISLRRPSSRASIDSHNNLTDDWIRNIVKPGTQNQIDEQSTLSFMTQTQQLHTSLSPQSSSSSNTNTHTSSSTTNSTNPWYNSTLAQQQHQIMQNKLNAANNSSQQLALSQQQLLLAWENNLIGSTNNNFNPMQLQKSQGTYTSSFIGNQGAPGMPPPNSQNFHSEFHNLDEFIPFGSNGTSIAQNFSQMTKVIAPEIANLQEASLPSTNFTAPSPSDQQFCSSLGTIGSGINSLMVDQQQRQSSFAGNGNLNPPIRTNVTMTPMKLRKKFGALGAGKAHLHSPHGFCLGVDEEIIIADTNNHRICIFDNEGEFKSSFGIAGKEDGQLYFPRKVAVKRDTGHFVVCDRGNERSRMQIFSKSGHYLKKISIRYIDIVAGLVVAPNGDIVAVDSVSPTVFRINDEGELIKWFDCSDYMREPSDIAISGNEYFVCDFKGHCVCVFDQDGNFVRRIGGENLTNFPNGIEVSDAGDVLIGDSHGNRFHVAVFTRVGDMIKEFECNSVKVSRCCGLKITSEGYVVTLAKNNHHVLVLDTLYVN